MQRLAHRDTGVLETSEMDHTRDLMFGEDPVEQFALQDAAFVERDVLSNEAAVPGRQVVDHDSWHAFGGKGAYDVGADVSRTTSHQPGHRLVLLSPLSVTGSALAGRGSSGPEPVQLRRSRL